MINIKLFGISKTKSFMIIKIIARLYDIVEKLVFLIILTGILTDLTIILTYLTHFKCKVSEKLSIIRDWLDLETRKNIPINHNSVSVTVYNIVQVWSNSIGIE